MNAIKQLQISILGLEEEVNRLIVNCEAVELYQKDLTAVCQVWKSWLDNARKLSD